MTRPRHHILWPLQHTPHAIEQMDGRYVTLQELLSVECALDRINFLSGSFFRTAQWMLDTYRRNNSPHFSFLDIGCGGGGLLRYLHRFSKKKSLKISFSGIDTNVSLLSLAKEKSVDFPTIEYSSERIEAIDRTHSMIYSNLVLHHLPPEEILPFLRLTREKAMGEVRHEDLLRSKLGLAFATGIPRLLTKSPIVHHDAQISVHRSYTREEWRERALEAGYSFQAVFPERAQLRASHVG